MFLYSPPFPVPSLPAMSLSFGMKFSDISLKINRPTMNQGMAPGWISNDIERSRTTCGHTPVFICRLHHIWRCRGIGRIGPQAANDDKLHATYKLLMNYLLLFAALYAWVYFVNTIVFLLWSVCQFPLASIVFRKAFRVLMNFFIRHLCTSDFIICIILYSRLRYIALL